MKLVIDNAQNKTIIALYTLETKPNADVIDYTNKGLSKIDQGRLLTGEILNQLNPHTATTITKDTENERPNGLSATHTFGVTRHRATNVQGIRV